MKALTHYFQVIREGAGRATDTVLDMRHAHVEKAGGPPGMREFQICIGCALAGAAVVGIAGAALGYGPILAGFVGFAACGAAARKGVMDGLGGSR